MFYTITYNNFLYPKNKKPQPARTSKHELTSVQSSCIPTNQHHEPRTRIPASTKQQSPTKDTNQPAASTNQHELTSVQSSCIPTNQHHEPRTRIPASTKQQSPTKDTDTSKHQAAITYQGHEPTSNQHQAGTYHQQARTHQRSK